MDAEIAILPAIAVVVTPRAGGDDAAAVAEDVTEVEEDDSSTLHGPEWPVAGEVASWFDAGVRL